jgi:hypothetical protein
VCSHPEHEISERADGSVAETHVFTAEELEQIAHWKAVIGRMAPEAD